MLSLAPAQAATRFDDITVNVEQLPTGNSAHGYTEYPITLINHSTTQAHRVKLSIPKLRYHPGVDYIREISRTVDVGPNATVHVVLTQPALPFVPGSGLAVTIDGKEEEESLALTINQSSSGSPYARYSSGFYSGTSLSFQPYVLLSRGVSNDFLEWASRVSGFPGGIAAPPHLGGGIMKPVAPAAPVAGMGKTVLLQYPRADGPVTSWSSNWLSYSRYDGLVVTGEELGTMPAGVQSALWQYVESGGSLLVLGKAALPDTWQRRHQEVAGFTIHYAGFGQCLVSPDTNVSSWQSARWLPLYNSWKQTAGPWQKTRTTTEVNRQFPVVDDIGIPVTGLFLVVTTFALTIGPVNLYVLSRQKRRIWMLWTVPLISSMTCVAVFAYMLVVEGWHGQLRTEGITILDEGSRRAASIGWTAFYTPLTPGDGLHFSNDTELVPQIAQDSWHRGGSARAIDWTQEQHLTSGWVPARTPAHFLVRKCETRRERVTLNRESDGSLTLVNGLGAPVTEFWYADDQKRLYRAGPVPAGEKAIMKPTGETLAAEPALDVWRQVLAGDWLMTRKNAKENPKDFLVPRSYLAALEETPFFEDGLRQTRSRKCSSIVVGLPSHDPAGK